MKLKGKHTSIFLILIAGLIICAHAVIPHHHHFDSIEAHPENLECETTNTDSHNENPDTHCHALNIVVSEKANRRAVTVTIALKPFLDLFTVPHKPDLKLTIKEIIQPIYLGVSPPEQIFLTNHSLRAPPATV